MRDNCRQQELLKAASCSAVRLEGQQPCQRHPVIRERERGEKKNKEKEVQDEWGDD